MKRAIIFFILFLFGLKIINYSDNKEIRVRIIPNSNNIDDLKIKEDIKSIVIYYLEYMYDDDFDIYYSNIKNSYLDLKNVLKNISECDVSFKYHTIYNKAYNDNMIDNNTQVTLVITIGAGGGSNWWGSVYPKFLGECGDCEIEYKLLICEIYKNIKENFNED